MPLQSVAQSTGCFSQLEEETGAAESPGRAWPPTALAGDGKLTKPHIIFGKNCKI